MTTLAVATDGLAIYDAAGLPLFQTPTGGVVDAAGNAADINPANDLPRDATRNDIQQPTQLSQASTTTLDDQHKEPNAPTWTTSMLAALQSDNDE
jgi:hypothetical protein